MKNLFFTFFIIAALIFSCKKKDETPSTSTNSNGTPVTTGGTTTGSTPTPTNATSYYGFFTTGTYTSSIGSSSFASVNANAYFSNTAISYITTSSSVKVNKVELNGDSLIYINSTNPSSSNLYVQQNTPNLTTENWSIIGANSIPSFTYNNSALSPSCSNLNILQDSISKSAGFSITLNNVTNITSANVLLYNLGGGALPISKIITAGNNTINFTAGELSAFPTGTMSTLLAIIMENAHGVSVSGKSFKFSRAVQYSKYIKVNP